MLSDTLCNVRKNLQSNLKLNEYRLDILIKHIENCWTKDTIVYPSRIKSLLRISYLEVYEILNILKNMGILVYNYEIYCSECERFLDRPRLESLNQFPDNAYCDEGHKLSPTKDAILVYKVVVDG